MESLTKHVPYETLPAEMQPDGEVVEDAGSLEQIIGTSNHSTKQIQCFLLLNFRSIKSRKHDEIRHKRHGDIKPECWCKFMLPDELKKEIIQEEFRQKLLLHTGDEFGIRM